MSFSRELMKGVTETIVLNTIDDLGEAYGYELVKAIHQRSKYSLKLQEGTLYPLLYRLESKKYIKSVVKEATSGKSRRYYSLTSDGKKQLAYNKKEIKNFFMQVRGALNSAY